MLATLLCLVYPNPSVTQVPARPSAAQGQCPAVAQLDAYVDRFRRTGDASDTESLRQAAQRLDDASRSFLGAADSVTAASCALHAGDALRMSSQFDSALTRYAAALQIARQIRNPQIVTDALIGQSRALWYGLKDIDGAMSSVDEAVRLSATLPERNTLLKALTLKAELETGRGDPAAAQDWSNRAIAAAAQATDPGLLFYAYLERAETYLHVAETCDNQPTFDICDAAAALARRDYEAAQRVAERVGWVALAHQSGQFAVSIESRRALIANRRRMHELLAHTDLFHPLTASEVVVHQTFVFPGMGVPPALLEIVQQMGGVRSGDARSAYVNGSLAEMTGDTDAALRWYLDAVRLVEADRRRLQDGEARATFLEDKAEFYFLPTLHLLQRGQTDSAFRLMEAARSRVLTDLLTAKPLAFADSAERGAFGRLLDLRAQIALRQKDLYHLRSRDDVDTITVREDERKIIDLEARHADVLREMGAHTPRLLALVASDPVTLTQLQHSVAAEGCDLLEYLVTEAGVILWHVGATGVHVRNVILPRAELARKVESLRNSLNAPGTFDARSARELFLFLVEPAVQWLSTDHLVIIPHEELYYAPFQVFQNPVDSSYVGERFRLSYAPSATVWLQLRSVGPLTQGAVLVASGPGVPDAAVELHALELTFGSRATVLPEATESAVRSRVPGMRVVHLAAHGTFVGPEPLLSAIELKAGRGEDGLLRAAEMFALALDSAELVTLSACETGRVRATHGGEVTGMMQALLYAGAQALLLSHWKVDSRATAQWMQAFYAEAARSSLPEAMRRAVRTLKRDGRHGDPHFWGAFFLVGR